MAVPCDSPGWREDLYLYPELSEKTKLFNSVLLYKEKTPSKVFFQFQQYNSLRGVKLITKKQMLASYQLHISIYKYTLSPGGYLSMDTLF